MATRVLSVRATDAEIVQWRLAAQEQGLSLAGWMHDVVAEVAAGMGYIPGAQLIDGQLEIGAAGGVEGSVGQSADGGDAAIGDPVVGGWTDSRPEGPVAQPVEHPLDTREDAGSIPAGSIVPPAPVIPPVMLPPEQGGRPPVEAVSTLKPTCQAAHLHFRLGRGETCMFCGGQE